MSATPSRPRRRWEERTLAVLAYPANLALAGVAGFLLALPVVTWLVAWVAAGRALHGWLAGDDHRAFTGTFREFAATWRRSLPASVLATLVVVVLATNLLFLGSQDTPVAFLFGMATIPVAAAVALVVLMLPAAAAFDRDASMGEWLRAAAGLAVARPLGSLVLLVVVAGFGLTCAVLPTIVPFFGISLPVWLGLVTAGRARL
ncbi:MAG: hypothetical protein GEV12_00745 [Micromonosporaceae bacterium]|nr:hypothetical protein [Micromonosporaceae bacterium]